MVERRFSEDERRVLYEVMGARRDIRAYRPEPLSPAVLGRILHAAHHAPSVGFMQPWDFICVQQRALRQRIYEHFVEANQRAAARFAGERRVRYDALKLQGILDAPLNLVVTCDHQRGGEHVLGRDTMPETDTYSTCLAIQNLWLAARAEGVGVGWMSIMEPEVVKPLLGIPPHFSLIAYLTVGYAVEFPDRPMLQSVGWRRRMPLQELTHLDRFGDHYALPVVEEEGLRPEGTLRVQDAVEPAAGPEHARVQMPAEHDNFGPLASGDLAQRLDQLTKPVGSLGRLESLALQLARCQQRAFPEVGRAHALVFAADHGVTAERVSAYRPQVTAKMVYQFIAGGGAINAFARQYGVGVRVVDVGVDHDFAGATGLVHGKVCRGTRNLVHTAAMTADEYEQALQVGREQVRSLWPLDVLLVGELGIGNSTSAAALCCGLLGLAADEVVGRGTGVNDATWARKREAVRQGVSRWRLETGSAGCEAGGVTQDVPRLLQHLGGLEIVALVGALLEARNLALPVVLDGLMTGVAALAAVRMCPELRPQLIAGHRSPEPAHLPVLQALDLVPLLDLGLRLGEGSGAALAMGLIQSAHRLCQDMRTFEEAGIEHPLEPG